MSSKSLQPMAADAQWTELRSDLDRAMAERVTLAFLGSASAGKDAAIRALFGIDFGQVDPIPGSTEDLRVVDIAGDGRFLVVNAPGFGDVRQDVDSVARQVLESLDVVIYVVNAEGGATIDEKNDLADIKARGAGDYPTLVALNKIDLIREHQREEFVAATLAQLDVSPQDAVICAFDPHPALADRPIGLEQVIDWIDASLRERGKELLFAKHLRDKRLACQPIIKAAARKAALAGAVPVPGADITAVTWIQVRMVEELAAVHGQKLDRDVILWLVGELLAGTSKGFVRRAVDGLKIAGWIPGGQAIAATAVAAVAGSLSAAITVATGEAAIHFLQSEQRLEMDELKVIFNNVASTQGKAMGIKAE